MFMRRGDMKAAALLAVTVVVMIASIAMLASASPAAGDQQPSALQPSALYEVYINSGGGAYTDTLGNRWAADRAYSAGSWGYVGGGAATYGYAIAGTNDDPLYQSMRYWSSTTGTYRFDDAPPGVYEVDLRFAELTQGAWGKRSMDVEIQGVRFLASMDIWSAAGLQTAYDWTFVVTVTSGPLTIDFIPHLGSNPYGATNQSIVNAVHVRQLDTYTPPPSAPYPRIGVGVNWAFGDVYNYNVGQLHLGWYATWSLRLNPPRPNGIEFVQLIDTSGVVSTTYDWTIVGNVIDRNPGSTFIVGNEVEANFQGNHTPAQYAGLYSAFYHYIKGRDPTARVGLGGIVMVSEARLRWLQGVLDAYAATHNGARMPMDFWTIHEQILGGSEYPNNWPVGIGAPRAGENEYHSWECNKSGGPDDVRQFKNDVIRFRQWMNEKGYRETPLWISEYGVLSGDSYNCTQKAIGQYLVQTMEWLNTATDASIGLPDDENRLVQRWLWYSMNDQPYNKDTGQGFSGALYYHGSPSYPGAMTGVGRAMRDWVNAITPPGPTPTPTETRTPTVTPTPTSTRTPLPPGNGVLQGAVQLQGRGAPPSALWTVPLTVGLFLPGDNLPAYQFATTTDDTGSFSVPAASTPGVWPSSYNVKVKNPQMLQAGASGLEIVADAPTVYDFGVLKGGDANNDNQVSLADVSILASTYGKSEGEAGYDARADFTGDTKVELADVSIIAANYNRTGVNVAAESQVQAAVGPGLAAAPAVRLVVVPGSQNVTVGQSFSVDFRVNVTSGLADTVSFAATYDPALLQALTVTCSGSPFADFQTCTAGGGTASFTGAIFAPKTPMGPGDYFLMRVTFRALAVSAGTQVQYTAGQACYIGSCAPASPRTPGQFVITNPPTPTRTVTPGGPTPTPTPTPPPLNIGVNAGGPAYTDRQGFTWQADQAYTPGSWGYIGGVGQTYSASNPIANTEDDPLYQTEHWGMSQYAFDVAPGVYSVTLKFAEIYYATMVGGRVFDVKAEGFTVISGLDVLREAGRYAALDRSFLVPVDDWQLNLEFSALAGSAKVNAIRVAYVGGGPATATPTATATATSPAATATPTVTATATATARPKDPYEPNETFEQATPMQPGTDYLGYIESEQDVDVYAFTVSDPNGFIWASLTDLPADYDLFLYAPDRSLLAWSTYAGLTPEYILNQPVDGTVGQYYLRVVGYARAMNSEAPYRLRLELRSATPTVTPTRTATGTATATRTPTATATRQPLDPNEPNDTFEQATALTAGVPMLGYIDSASDVDYYRLTVPAGGKQIAVSLTLLPADYDLYLADSGCNVVAMSRYGGTANEFIFYTAPAAGTYYIYVAGFNHAYNPSATYRLLAQVN